jgi:hypothetical protein
MRGGMVYHLYLNLGYLHKYEKLYEKSCNNPGSLPDTDMRVRGLASRGFKSVRTRCWTLPARRDADARRDGSRPLTATLAPQSGQLKLSDFCGMADPGGWNGGMCEQCGLVSKNYGVPEDDYRKRWCGTCAVAHGAVLTRTAREANPRPSAGSSPARRGPGRPASAASASQPAQSPPIQARPVQPRARARGGSGGSLEPPGLRRTYIHAVYT